MTIKSTSVQELDRSVSDLYLAALEGGSPESAELLYREDINSTKFAHSFLEGIPAFRDWDGPKVAKDVSIGSIAGTVKKKELTIQISVDDFRSGNINRYLDIAGRMGVRAALLPDEMLAAWLEGATTSDAEHNNYDGVATFTQHTTESGHLNDNDLALSLSPTNLETAVEKMMAFKNEEGAPLGVMPTHIVVPPALYYTAVKIMANEYDASGASNIFFKSPLKIIVNKHLTSSTRWYLFDASKAEPFVMYVFQDPNEIVVKDSATDDNVFLDDVVLWSAVGKLAIRPAPYQYMLTSSS